MQRLVTLPAGEGGVVIFGYQGSEFVTFVLGRLKLSIEHRKKKRKGIGKKIKDKTARNLGLTDTTVHTRGDGPSR